jgi:hypothetical protein
LSEKDVPPAAVVKDGKLGGDVPRTTGSHPIVYKRKLANFLIDKKLQLRYVILVTTLSAVITGVLGYLMYRQENEVTEVLAADVMAETGDAELAAQAKDDMESEDQGLIYRMVIVGAGLVIILSLYLTVMTHKVAGPLYKVSLYFDRMTEGKLGKVTALRKGDMLQDFYGNFREMHDALRGRQLADVAAMEKFLAAAGGVSRSGEIGHELDDLQKHLNQRKAALVDFPPRANTKS